MFAHVHNDNNNEKKIMREKKFNEENKIIK
jgi:hypothetical protein